MDSRDSLTLPNPGSHTPKSPLLASSTRSVAGRRERDLRRGDPTLTPFPTMGSRAPTLRELFECGSPKVLSADPPPANPAGAHAAPAAVAVTLRADAVPTLPRAIQNSQLISAPEGTEGLSSYPLPGRTSGQFPFKELVLPLHKLWLQEGSQPLRRLQACLQVVSHYYARNAISSK